MASLFPNPPQTLTEASFSSAVLRRRINNLETQVETAQGQRIAVLFSSSPVPGRNIDMGVVGIIKNIDELMNARIAREHALREAEDAHRRIDALLKSVADGLIVTDLSGNCTETSANVLVMHDRRKSKKEIDPLVLDKRGKSKRRGR